VRHARATSIVVIPRTSDSGDRKPASAVELLAPASRTKPASGADIAARIFAIAGLLALFEFILVVPCAQISLTREGRNDKCASCSTKWPENL
jgi:hypothetical protein